MLYVSTDVNEAHSDPDLPHIYTNLNEDPSNNDVGDGDVDEDDGDVDGPTVEARVELSKTACKYSLTYITKI